jgi:hypothetical protein
MSETDSDDMDDVLEPLATQILTPEHTNTGSEAKPRSWVYSHSEKRRIGEQTYFYCQHKYKSGKQCTFKVESLSSFN